MSVTGSQIRAALSSVGGVGGQGWDLDVLAKGANAAMAQAGITTRQGAACFMAQCMVESAYFRVTREYGGANTRYAPYYGRGFIQVTWKANYKAFGKWCQKKNLVKSANYFMSPNEDRLADDRWAWLGAVWYMTTHKHDLIDLANRGDNIRVGRAINRGTAYSSYAAYGEDHRTAAYNAFLKAGISAPDSKAVLASGRKYTRDEVAFFQRVIVERPNDGLWGKGTEKQAQALRRCLKPGMKASRWDKVRYWRARLAKKNQNSVRMRRAHQMALKVKVDGDWGPSTDAAWLAMRAQHKMKGV